jgi:hypothetical protein
VLDAIDERDNAQICAFIYELEIMMYHRRLHPTKPTHLVFAEYDRSDEISW